MDIGRLLTAMVTPFTADERLDEEGVTRAVNHLIDTGTTGIVVCGTTGESPTLSHAEKLRLMELTVSAAAGRIPVIAGTGSNDTAATVSFTREVAELGVDGIMLVAPYYNRPTQSGLYAHFATVADAVDLPIMLYNIPGRTGCRVEVDTLLRLTQHANVFAVKEASGDLGHIMRLCAEKPDDFLVLSGDDKLTLPILAVGGAGVVSVTAHVAGPEMALMMEAFFAGRIQEAATWNGRLLPLFEVMFHPATASPAPVKCALNQIGVPVGGTRLPITAVPPDVETQIRGQLSRLRKLEGSHASPFMIPS